MKTVILAAGFGSRLKHKTKDKGKALVELNSRPLIDYALEFTNHTDVEHRYVVGGFTYPLLKKHLEKLNPDRTTVLENKDYKKGNLITLKTALDYFDDDMLIMNVDHIYNPIIFNVVKNNIAGITGIVDSDRNLTDDDMKVKIDSWGRITEIDKKLTRFDKGYIGMTTISKENIGLYKKAIDTVSQTLGESANVEAVLHYLASTNTQPRTLDVSSFRWLEIDTPEELQTAEKALHDLPDRFPYFKKDNA